MFVLQLQELSKKGWTTTLRPAIPMALECPRCGCRMTLQPHKRAMMRSRSPMTGEKWEVGNVTEAKPTTCSPMLLMLLGSSRFWVASE